MASLTRNENTSKHATGRKFRRPVPTVAHRWAWLGGSLSFERTGASQVLPFSLSRCHVCMGYRVIVFRKGQRLATRCVSWRIDLIDTASRSLWLFLGVPTRSRLRSFLSRSESFFSQMAKEVRLSGGEAAGRY